MDYTIGQAAKRCGLTASTLRYYEKEGIVAPMRTSSGLRRYTEEDINWLHFIDHMRATGMSVNNLRRYVQLRRKHASDSQTELLEILREHEKHLKKQLEQYQTNLDLVQYKIKMYESELAQRNVDLYELYKERKCSQHKPHLPGPAQKSPS